MKGRVETRQRHCHCQIELFMLMLMLWHHWHGFPAWPGSGAVSVSFITISGAQRLAHTKTTQTTVGQSTAAEHKRVTFTPTKNKYKNARFHSIIGHFDTLMNPLWNAAISSQLYHDLGYLQ